MSGAARRISAPNSRLFRAPVISAATAISVLTGAATIRPAMSAAYQTLTREAMPRATTVMNIVRTVGGSICVALFGFGDYVLANMEANRVGTVPTLYRLADPHRRVDQSTSGCS